MNKAEELIACLEGEIAKRDARIVELEHRCGVYGLELHNATERLQQAERQIKAIKAQEPVAWAGVIEDCASLFVTEPQLWKAIPLYAAPVSEAKAQGVVMLPSVTEVMNIVFDYQHNKNKNVTGTTNWAANIGMAVIDEIARLNAAPVQQVSVPDGWKLVPVNATEAILDVLYSNGMDESDSLLQDIWSAMIAAAPAAPAADAGLVDMYRHLQTVTPYRFKKIQDASVTDGGDVLYFHKDRFDAALLDDMAANCAAKGVV